LHTFLESAQKQKARRLLSAGLNPKIALD
jgi:hypothetical protein